MAGKQLASDAVHLRQRGRHHDLRQGQDTRKAHIPLTAFAECWRPRTAGAPYLWDTMDSIRSTNCGSKNIWGKGLYCY